MGKNFRRGVVKNMKKFTSQEIKEFVSKHLFEENIILNKDCARNIIKVLGYWFIYENKLSKKIKYISAFDRFGEIYKTKNFEFSIFSCAH
jgi:hypothetical protein